MLRYFIFFITYCLLCGCFHSPKQHFIEKRLNKNQIKDCEAREKNKCNDERMACKLEYGNSKLEPTYSEARRNIPTSSKVFAVISAMGYGLAGRKDATSAMDRLIERSYRDLGTYKKCEYEFNKCVEVAYSNCEEKYNP